MSRPIVPAYRRTWFWEQAALAAILAWAVQAQLREQRALGVRGAVLIVASAAIAFAAQKVRSMADRQRESNAAAGVANAPMDCAGRVAIWGAVLQALALFAGMAAAPTDAHVALAVYVALYPFWRRLYRSVRPRAERLTTIGGDVIARRAPDGSYEIEGGGP